VLHKRVHADLEKTLGLRAEPQRLGIARWRRAIPQPDAAHPQRLVALHRQAAELPGLALAGAYLGGVAVADALASGLDAARRLVQAAD
jgi:oxygen-dependent protoporphyrinogen oxidase